ncbi:MAG: hypothetical protein AAB462_04685 [Patescibacteria group bacterium]
MDRNELEDIKKGIEIIGDADAIQNRRIYELTEELMDMDLQAVQDRMDLAASMLNVFCDEYVQDRDLAPAYRGRGEEDPAQSLMAGGSFVETSTLGDDKLKLSYSDVSGCHANCPDYDTTRWHHGGPNARFRRVTLSMYSENTAYWTVFDVETIPHDPLDAFEVGSDAYRTHIETYVAPLLEAAETIDALLGDINDNSGIALY